jgi:hypothetical protein
MSYYEKIADWTAIIVASGWGSSRGGCPIERVYENSACASAYTTAIFFVLPLALRPAWRRLQRWVDSLILLALHRVLLLSIVHLPETHSIRLSWAIAIPFLMVEVRLALGVLWRRNVI